MEITKFDGIWLDCEQNILGVPYDAKIILLRIGNEVFMSFYSVDMINLYASCHKHIVHFSRNEKKIYLNEGKINKDAILEFSADQVAIKALECSAENVAIKATESCAYIINRQNFEEAINQLMGVSK
ncbi:hypothetical protein ACFL23_00640 [Patescibacteria group bacterium]